MSKNQKPSSHPNGSSEVHAISMDEFGGTIPGVTQLLNPGLERKQNVTTSKGQKTKINLKFGNTSTGIQRPENAESISPKNETGEIPRSPAPLELNPRNSAETGTLGELGVRLVLVFSKSGGAHRFDSTGPESPEPLSAWQKEFYQGMVLDPGILSIERDFCEFSAKNSKFQGDAFGLEESEWLLLLKNNSSWYALISRKSLQGKQDAIERACFGKTQKNETSGEIKIEIA
jgi:hypothetical protein